MRAGLSEAITQLGLDYRLMTQFTSFVAVEEMTVTDGGQPRRIEVPVEMPDGVSYEGVFGEQPALANQAAMPMSARLARSAPMAGVVGGVIGSSQEAPAPPPPAPVFAQKARRFDAADRKEPPSKLDPGLAAIVARIKSGNRPAPTEAGLVRDGKAAVQVWLNDTSEGALAQLKALGFTIIAQPTTSKLVIGRIPVEKLEALSKLACVRYLAPAKL
jgi:Ca-activated chloride channel homolog